MKNNAKEMKAMIASRASRSGKRFFKSYVRNIRVAEIRHIPDHISGFKEVDYFFEYKGKEYRVNQCICPNINDEVKYSARYRYETLSVK